MQCFALELIASDMNCSLRCILLSCCEIFQIHVQTTSQKDAMRRKEKNKTKTKINSVRVYAAMAQQFWQILQATTTKELLVRCQTIITAIRLGRLVNLHLGITLWHQGEESVLCSVRVCQTHRRGSWTSSQRANAGTDLTQSGASPALSSPSQTLLYW